MPRRLPVVMRERCVMRSIFATASKETSMPSIGAYNRGCGAGFLAPVLSSGHEVVDLGCRDAIRWWCDRRGAAGEEILSDRVSFQTHNHPRSPSARKEFDSVYAN